MSSRQARLPEAELVAEPHADHVAQHREARRDDVELALDELRALDLLPAHGDLGDGDVEPLAQVHELDVERPPEREGLSFIPDPPASTSNAHRSRWRLQKSVAAACRVKSLNPHCVSRIFALQSSETKKWKPNMRIVRRSERCATDVSCMCARLPTATPTRPCAPPASTATASSAASSLSRSAISVAPSASAISALAPRIDSMP